LLEISKILFIDFMLSKEIIFGMKVATNKLFMSREH
jgi:hypothetical protein